MAVRVLAEAGIGHAGWSKGIEALPKSAFDLVVTVCDSAAEECPIWLGTAGRRAHRGYADPAAATGADESRLEAFREVRDALLRDLPELLQVN